MRLRTVSFLFIIILFLVSLVVCTSQTGYSTSEGGSRNIAAFESTATDWWSVLGHDPSRIGFSQSSAPISNDTLWIYDTGHQVTSSPVVHDDILLIGRGTSDNHLYAINATTGLLLWKQPNGASSPCAYNGKVIFESESGLHALDINTGRAIWNSSYNGWLYSPVATNGRVFAVGGNNVFAFGENDGKEIWRFSSTSYFSSPAIANNVVYVGSYGVYALDASSGEQIWNYMTNDRTEVLTVADNKVFVSSMGGAGSADTASRLVALDANSGNFLWSFNANPHGRTDAKFAASAFHNGRIFVSSSMSIDNYGSLFAFEANTGALLWKSSVGAYISAPAIADGRVYLLSYDGQVHSFSESSGDLVWSYATGGSASHSSPAVAEGRVYVGSGNGKIYCFGSMLYFNITIAPNFYDNRGEPLVPSPSSWTVVFPNGTKRIMLSPETFSAPLGTYYIDSITWKGLNIGRGLPPPNPTMTSAPFFLDSDITWSPRINCTLPSDMSLSLSSSTSYIGFKVGIDGNLTCNEIGVSDADILIFYSVTAGKSWNDITLVNTALSGLYSAVWMPQATGNYVVKAVWAGNSTYPASTMTVNLAVIPFEERNVFSVVSNSTVTELNFESVQRELTFTVSGGAGTMGYADVYIAKTLIGNIEEVEVKLNGTEIDYTATSLDDSWLIHFSYQHSSHTVAVNLGLETEVIDGGLPLLLYFIVGVAAIALIVVGVLILRRRLRKKQ